MPNIVPITKNEFIDKRWKQPDNYLFAANDLVCPLTQQELKKAVLSLPIGFIVQQDKAIPVAVLGIKPEQNLLVSPEGRWLGRYIPAAYRAYPFTMGATKEGEQLLCIDTDSGCVNATEGHLFFTETDDQPSEETNNILNLLTQLHNDRLQTEKICAVLFQYELIQPWPIKLKSDGNETKVEGLYRIDEDALGQLDSEIFDEVRSVGALPLIYCQLLSMQHLQSLGILVSKQEQKTATDKLDIEDLFGDKDDLISFDF